MWKIHFSRAQRFPDAEGNLAETYRHNVPTNIAIVLKEYLLFFVNC